MPQAGELKSRGAQFFESRDATTYGPNATHCVNRLQAAGEQHIRQYALAAQDRHIQYAIAGFAPIVYYADDGVPANRFQQFNNCFPVTAAAVHDNGVRLVGFFRNLSFYWLSSF